MISQVSSFHKIKDEIERIAVLEGEMHVYDERRVELRKKYALVHYTLHAFLGHYSTVIAFLHGFEHLFHRVLILRLLVLDFPHFAEATFADYV